LGNRNADFKDKTMQSLSNHYKVKLPQIGLAVLLGFVLLVENVAAIFYADRQIQHSTALVPLYAITTSTILMLWVHYDSRSRNITMGMDQAMYIFFVWPITFPYYVFKSRGFRSGSLLLLSFVGIYIFTFIAAIVIAIGINLGLSIFVAGS
jgi:hypothetical protein